MTIASSQPNSPQFAKLMHAVGLLYANPHELARELVNHRALYDFLCSTQGTLSADHTAEQIATYYRQLRWHPEVYGQRTTAQKNLATIESPSATMMEV